ncbi:NAD(P)/FAD-dependent oxidoreductase [Beijerinckia sp. L45]|uniref:FAD-dependent oxidoreductase n=1 Tax=Beijerinckia sp. L45 TaxID=1641855 RepID=UPI00131EAE86|nr:FAD-dependent monooxygenase [Beijerinckia sp. L45]
MSDSNRVLIIGGGPVGALAGYSLARRGIPVIVFDRLAEPARDHRAATLQPSTLDLFAPIGLVDKVIERGLVSSHFQWRDGETDAIVAEFDHGCLADVSAHPFVVQLEQHKTIQIILEAAEKLPDFTVLRPVDVMAVRQSADRVEADIRDTDGRVTTHTGTYMLGCDGGRSIVRHATSVTFEGFTWEERFNVLTTKTDFAAIKNFRYRNYCAHPTRWAAVFKVPGDDGLGLWRAVFPARAEETDAQVMSDGWIHDRFDEFLPGRPEIKVEHRNMYAVHQRVAGSFREGRFILAGDAAHINNPLGGMGMNSGFQDALNAADKLEMIWNGAAPEPLLDLYDRQRRLTALEFVQAQSIANKKTLEENDREARQVGLDRMRRTAEDPVACHAFLMRSSLIAMVQRAEEIA